MEHSTLALDGCGYPYGSGPSEVILDQVVGKKAEVLEGWKGGKVIRVFVGK